jgi:ribosomal protein L11 methyltransferase
MLIRVAGGLVVRSWWRPCRAAPGERVLTVRAGSVFPPTHPTTRLCLDLLAARLGEASAGSLLDVGCGSGILALAGAALGAARVIAVDLSLRAVRQTRDNGGQAGLWRHLAVVQGSTECLRGPFAVVVANLPLAVQAAKVAECHRLAGPDGVLILSGFRDTQEESLAAAYAQLGWQLTQRCTRDAWAPEMPPELSYTWVAWRLQRRL